MMDEIWDYDYIFKLIVIGDSNVGKTTFFNKIQYKSHLSTHTTIGVDYCTINTNIDDKCVKINVWDTAGQERYQSVTNAYFKEISGIILMFNVNDTTFFKNLQTWLRRINNSNTCDHSHPILLLGNKADKLNVINGNELDMFINEHDIIYNEISCLYDINLEEVIEKFVVKILSQPDITNCKGIRQSTIDKMYSLNKPIKTNKGFQKCCIIN